MLFRSQVLVRMWRKGNPSTLSVGTQIGAATMENSMEVSQKIKIPNDPEIPLLGMYLEKNHIFFDHSSVDGHLSCFHVLAIVNNVAVNVGVHVSFQISVFVFSGYMPSSGC